jgi:hypothetical protein
MREMKANPECLRASFRSVAGRVDREAKALLGYVVAQEGPFKSDGRGEFDAEGLAALRDLGNANPKGLKSRFTHPDMSNDGLGKHLGRARNFRMDSAIDARTGKRVNAVRADLHFAETAFKTPSGDLASYVMDLAEEDPDALSSSVVVSAKEELRTDKSGRVLADGDGNPLPPLWRPTALHASDIVDTGDAVDGLLSSGIDTDGLPLDALWKGSELLDKLFAEQPRHVIEARLTAYVQRYLSRRFGEEVKPSTPNLDKLRLRLQEIDLNTKRRIQ